MAYQSIHQVKQAGVQLDDPQPLPAQQHLELAGLLAVGIAPFYLNGLYNGPLAAGSRPSFWVVEALAWVVLPAAVLLVARRRGLFAPADLGLHAYVRGRHRPATVLALAIVVSVVFLRLDVWAAHGAHAALPAGWPVPGFRYSDVLPPPGPRTGGWRLLAVVYLCVTAGVVEELYYRAMFDRLFPRGPAGAAGYVAASSIIFAGAHWEGGLPNVAEALAVGLFAAALFRLTRNLWPLVAGHVLTDWYWLAGAG